MHVLIATDAWRPQINGVVRTLESVSREIERSGSRVTLITPDGFRTFPLPTYPDLRCALPRPRQIRHRIEEAKPDAIHIATEGPIGFCVRRYCVSRGIPFTTSFTTRFSEYVSARLPMPLSWGYAVLKWFHAPAHGLMVSTDSLKAELSGRGFSRLCHWSRGVDTELFHPDRTTELDLPRPIFMTVGRIAIEKNLEAFLDLDLPGSKVLIGKGPQEEELRRRYPQATFLGPMHGERLAAHLAAADVFVFPSRTDTFGIAQLEALAAGVPVAAYPVTGPKDVIGSAPVGILDPDLGKACLAALSLPKAACREHAMGYSWQNSARQFLSNCAQIPVDAFHSVPAVAERSPPDADMAPMQNRR